MNIDGANRPTPVHGPIPGTLAAMRVPVSCKWCFHVHDAATVTVEQRYADCSCWRCPNCDVLIDDRPRQWGGSAIPVDTG